MSALKERIRQREAAAMAQHDDACVGLSLGGSSSSSSSSSSSAMEGTKRQTAEFEATCTVKNRDGPHAKFFSLQQSSVMEEVNHYCSKYDYEPPPLPEYSPQYYRAASVITRCRCVTDGGRDVTSLPPVGSARTHDLYSNASNANVLKVRLDTRPASPAQGDFPACEFNAGKVRRRLRAKGKPTWANT